MSHSSRPPTDMRNPLSRIEWAYRCEVKGAAKAVLVYVAFREPCYASVETIASHVGFGVSTVREALRRLEAGELIVCVRVSKGGRARSGQGLTSSYRLNNPPATGGLHGTNPPDTGDNPPATGDNPPATGDKHPYEQPHQPPHQPPRERVRDQPPAPPAATVGAGGGGLASPSEKNPRRCRRGSGAAAKPRTR